ncbi:MAG: hypothetical protein E4G90_01500 [Gemmatimonadales bacterium]|nr:MAG: hypothetical protein E4G90_01500 [Gemmatimonadales bacterium]
MIGSGADRKWLIPLDTKGNVQADHLGIEEDVIGCHSGAYSGLNVCNPQPGFEYQWPLNPMGQNGNFDPAAMHAIHQMGGEIVKESDPEYAVYRKFQSGMESSPLDSNTVYRELCLVRIPSEKLRESRNKIEELNLRRLRRGPEEAFVRGSSQSENQYGSQGPTRFRLSTHHSELQNGGQIEEILTPDSGVVKSENVS